MVYNPSNILLLGIDRATGAIPDHWWAPLVFKDLLEGHTYLSYQELP